MTNHLFYSDYVRNLLQSIQQFSDQKNYIYEPGYIEELNNICPSCQKELPLSPENEPQHGEVKILYVEDKYCIPYALCSFCSEVEQEPLSISMMNQILFEAPYPLKDYITSCLGIETNDKE